MKSDWTSGIEPRFSDAQAEALAEEAARADRLDRAEDLVALAVGLVGGEEEGEDAPEPEVRGQDGEGGQRGVAAAPRPMKKEAASRRPRTPRSAQRPAITAVEKSFCA